MLLSSKQTSYHVSFTRVLIYPIQHRTPCVEQDVVLWKWADVVPSSRKSQPLTFVLGVRSGVSPNQTCMFPRNYLHHVHHWEVNDEPRRSESTWTWSGNPQTGNNPIVCIPDRNQVNDGRARRRVLFCAICWPCLSNADASVKDGCPSSERQHSNSWL